MIDWLYSFPDWLLNAGWAVLMAAAITALPFLTQRLPWLRPTPENTDFVLRLQATLFTVTSIVVAFTLVQAEANYRKVDSLVSAEGSSINRLDRLLVRYGDAAAARVRPLLLTYTRSVVADEWPEMLHGGGSERTQRAFGAVTRGVLALDPQSSRQTMLYGEILRAFDAIAESRDSRLNAVTVSLSASFWEVVAFAVVILLFVSSAIERTRFRAVVLACQMAVLGSLIGFVFIVDQPFKGRSAVDPQPLQQAIALMEARDD